MPFVIGEVEVINEVSLAPTAVLAEGAVIADGDLSVKVNSFFWDMNGTHSKYVGSVANAVTDNTTNYVYLDSTGTLVINTTGYPGTGAHIRLARVVTQSAFIVRVLLERAFFSSSNYVPATVPDDTLFFGAAGIGTTTTSRYLAPGYTPNNAATSLIGIKMVRSGTLQNLRVHHNTVGVGGSVTYTVLVNGVASTLTTTFNASASDGSDTSHSVSVSAGDLIQFRVSKGASITTSPIDITATVEFNG